MDRFCQFSLVLSLMSLTTALAAETDRQVVEDRGNKFEVSVDRSSGRVRVKTDRMKDKAPKEMTVTLFSDPETSQTIRLKALNLTDPMPVYEGALSRQAQSYVGVELRFETSLKSLRVLRSMPRLPERGGGLR